MKITPERIAEIKAAEAAATDGPWRADDYYVYRKTGVLTLAVTHGPKENNDAAFIALARTAVPDLLTDREALTAEIKEIRKHSNAKMGNAELNEYLDGIETLQKENVALAERVEALTKINRRIRDSNDEVIMRAGEANHRAEKAESDLAERTCEWEEYEGMWRPGCCGETWEFTDGGPRENAVTHCMFCGGPMILATEKGGD